VNLALYDAAGRTVRQLVYSSKNPGQYSALWDGKNNSGLYVSAGIYFLRLEAGELSGTKRIIIVK
jgi:flagellar hook assembly protein FlgD